MRSMGDARRDVSLIRLREFKPSLARVLALSTQEIHPGVFTVEHVSNHAAILSCPTWWTGFLFGCDVQTRDVKCMVITMNRQDT